jgi:hypothetical protein
MNRRKFLEFLGIASLLPAVGITLDAVAAELPADITWWKEIYEQLQRARLVDGLPTYCHFETVTKLKREKRYAEAETLLLRVITAEKAVARINFEIKKAIDRAKTDPAMRKNLAAFRQTLYVNDSYRDVHCAPISRAGPPGAWLELAVVYSKQQKWTEERTILEQFIRLDADHIDTMHTRMDGITVRKIYLRYEKLMAKRFPLSALQAEDKIAQCHTFVSPYNGFARLPDIAPQTGGLKVKITLPDLQRI